MKADNFEIAVVTFYGTTVPIQVFSFRLSLQHYN